MNKRIREAVREFAYGDVYAFKCFYIGIAIFLIVKPSYSSNRIEMLILSAKTIVFLLNKLPRRKWASAQLEG